MPNPFWQRKIPLRSSCAGELQGRLVWPSRPHHAAALPPPPAWPAPCPHAKPQLLSPAWGEFVFGAACCWGQVAIRQPSPLPGAPRGCKVGLAFCFQRWDGGVERLPALAARPPSLVLLLLPPWHSQAGLCGQAGLLAAAVLPVKFPGRRVCGGESPCNGETKGWAQKSQVGRGPSPAVRSAPALPSLCTLRLLQEVFGAFRFLERTHTFKSLWCKLGSALDCLGACQHRREPGVMEHPERLRAVVSGGSWHHLPTSVKVWGIPARLHHPGVME